MITIAFGEFRACGAAIPIRPLREESDRRRERVLDALRGVRLLRAHDQPSALEIAKLIPPHLRRDPDEMPHEVVRGGVLPNPAHVLGKARLGEQPIGSGMS